MTEYAALLSGVCLLSATARLLLSDGALKKITDAAISLVLLVAVVRGALLISSSLDPGDFTRPRVEYEDSFVSSAEQSLGSAIRMAISEEFGIREAEVFVHCEGLDIETLKAELLTVTLCGEAAFSDHRRVREFVNSLDHGECEVRISFDR